MAINITYLFVKEMSDYSSEERSPERQSPHLTNRYGENGNEEDVEQEPAAAGVARALAIGQHAIAGVVRCGPGLPRGSCNRKGAPHAGRGGGDGHGSGP